MTNQGTNWNEWTSHDNHQRRIQTTVPNAAFFSAATQTDIVIDFNEEAEEEEQCKEQEAEMIVTESLDLAGEDCTEESIWDEDSGLDSVSEDEF